jgi:glutamine amidotransferase PdxT
MPITTSRNYFGRQRESFVADILIVDEKLRKRRNGNVVDDVEKEFETIFNGTSIFRGASVDKTFFRHY